MSLLPHFFKQNKPTLHISRSLGNRTLPTYTKEWRMLRQKVISKYDSTCFFCDTRLHKGIICDHLDGDGSNNTMSNLVLNCPGCYTIRHCGRSDVYKTLVFRKSSMDQIDIVKKYYTHYLQYGEMISRPELVDPYCELIQDHVVQVQGKTVLHVLNKYSNEKSPAAIANVLLDYKYDELDGLQEIKAFFTHRFSFDFLANT